MFYDRSWIQIETDLECLEFLDQYSRLPRTAKGLVTRFSLLPLQCGVSGAIEVSTPPSGGTEPF